MKIKLKDIPAQGLELSQDIEPSALGLEREDCPCLGPLKVQAAITKVSNTVLAHVVVNARYAFACARCLEEVESDCEEEFDFDYPVERGVESVDVGEDIRQEMLLGNPLKVLCREDCKGLCPGCGANLNHEKCKCKK